MQNVALGDRVAKVARADVTVYPVMVANNRHPSPISLRARTGSIVYCDDMAKIICLSFGKCFVSSLTGDINEDGPTGAFGSNGFAPVGM